MSKVKVKDNFTRSILTGGLSYLGSKHLLGYEESEIDLFNMSINSNVAFGLSAMAGSFIGSNVLQYGLSTLDQKTETSYKESRFIQPLVVGFSTYGISRSFGDSSILPVLGLGASSEVLSSYAQDSYMNMNDKTVGSESSPYV